MNTLTIQQGLLYGGIGGLILSFILPVPKIIAIIGGAGLGAYWVSTQPTGVTITPITQPTI